MINSNIVKSIDDYGDVKLTPEQIIEYTLEGFDVSDVMTTDEDSALQYQHMVDLTERENFPEINPPKQRKYAPDKYLKRKSTFWYVPSEYMYMDIVEYLVSRCSNEQEKSRVAAELIEFENRKEINILKVMVYVVDQFRKNNVVWGIGRGSSVSCFCLYLIGINKINPMVYDIPYTDFFKD